MSEKIALNSEDILAERIAHLRALFPEVFTEGKIDFDKLKEALGEEVAADRERYGLFWAGKSEAIRNVQTPSVGTLVPDREESINFDTTENLFIEGDNLEILKLLQKSYHGQVKMIYIDPPYNTGNDLIYPDNFREGLEDYLRYSGQVNGEGFKLSTNTETGGRYHSKWLNMMYPRLFLARNLLREDGVIVVSCNDNEQANLKIILSEVFGEENFAATFIWNNEGNIDNQSKIKTNHEYLHMFARDLDMLERPSVIDPNIEESSKLYKDEIENSITKNGPANPPSKIRLPAGFPATFESGVIEARRDTYPLIHDPIEVEDFRVVKPVTIESGWSSKNLLLLYINNGHQPIVDNEGKETWFSLTHTGAIYGYKRRPENQGHVLTVIRNVGTTKQNSGVLARWGLSFPFPKPVMLLRYLCQIATNRDDLILDYFAGSCTTAHAVLDLNQQEMSARKFIMVQLPEPVNDSNFPTVADIGKERIRQVIKKLNEEDDGQLGSKDTSQDRGFKVFKLTSSNFEIWDGAEATPDTEDELAKQLRAFADNVKRDRNQEEILYEILLKAGFPLNAPVETTDVAGEEVYTVEEGALLVCLAESVGEELLRGMVELEPVRVVCLDTAFHGNDRLKTNGRLEMRDRKIEFRTV